MSGTVLTTGVKICLKEVSLYTCCFPGSWWL